MVGTLLVMGLAGCADDTPENVAQEPANIVTDPTDYSYTETDGSGWHIHDYWNGEETVTVIDAMTRESSGTVFYGNGNALVARFQPEPNRVVPQGTGNLSATLQWTIEGGNHDHVELWVKGGADSSASSVGIVEPGVDIRFPSSHDQNDPPHQTLSLWEFELRAIRVDGQQVERTGFQATISVVAERGLEIPEWPAHPDFWQGATELVLVDQTFEVAWDVQFGLHACTGCVGGPSIPDGTIVPYDADRLEVTVTTESNSVPPLFGLRAHGANSRDHAAIPLTSESSTSRTWTLDPEVHTADSPYAKQSLWEFALHKQSTEATGDEGAWTGTYRATLTAFKDA